MAAISPVDKHRPPGHLLSYSLICRAGILSPLE